jgi:alpha-L-fucosidase
MKQIAELLEKYPDCFYFWNDAYDPGIGTAEEILELERGINPNILTASNWWNWGKKGTPYLDIAVKELRHFPEDNTAPGETCWKLEKGWFWKEGTGSGSAKSHLAHMAKAHARNSNYLLNVGPDRNGRIVPASLRVLQEIGKQRKK